MIDAIRKGSARVLCYVMPVCVLISLDSRASVGMPACLNIKVDYLLTGLFVRSWVGLCVCVCVCAWLFIRLAVGWLIDRLVVHVWLLFGLGWFCSWVVVYVVF